MAIARCAKCGEPKGRTQTYVARAHQVGHPNSSTVCGIKECEGAAFIWLNEQEKTAFDRGQRVFRFPTFAAKVRLESLA